MLAEPSRRRLLFALLSGLLAGCLERERGDTRTAQPTRTPTETEPRPTATQTPTQAMIDRLPEPSPLASTLEQLVLADDRKAFAAEHGIGFRDGAVKVQLELVEDGDPPADLLNEIESAYGPMVVAWADVDALVDVALTEDVRIVRAYSEPMAHDGR